MSGIEILEFQSFICLNELGKLYQFHWFYVILVFYMIGKLIVSPPSMYSIIKSKSSKTIQ